MKHLPVNDYLVICDRCGQELYASQCKLEWTGLFVCERKCWERKNEQENLRVPAENINVSIRRPPHQLPINACTTEGSSGVVGLGVVGCAVVGDVLDNVFASETGMYT